MRRRDYGASVNVRATQREQAQKHSVDTVDKTLVLHYHSSKAHLSVIVNKTLKMCLLN